MVTQAKRKKKPAKDIHQEKDSTKRRPQAEWLLIVGGSEKGRKEEAGRLQNEHLLKITEYCNPRLIRTRINNKPANVDIAGYDDDMLTTLLLGDIKGVDVSENPFFWLNKTKGRLLNLYGLNGLVLHNLDYGRNVVTIKLISDILKKIRVCNESINVPYGLFIVTLENKRNLKRISKVFTGMFRMLDIGSVQERGKLTRKGRTDRVPRDKLRPFLLKEYNYRKGLEQEGTELWPNTKIARGLVPKIKKRFGTEYGIGANYTQRYIENLISKIRKEKDII